MALVKPGSEFFFAVVCENYSDPAFTFLEYVQFLRKFDSDPNFAGEGRPSGV